MKTFFLFLIFSLSDFCSQQEIKGTYEVYKITITEDGDHFLFIKNEKDTGLVVMDNDSLKVDNTFKKIKTNKKYVFILEKERKRIYRGEQPSGYMIILNSGQIKKIWDISKDGEMPSIYTAKNIKGLYIKE